MIAAALITAALATAGHSEVVLRIDATSARNWEARPAWLGNRSDNPTVTAREGTLDFAVPEPGRGLKWALSFEPVDVFVYRWLVVRYRLVGYAPSTPDYVFWLNAETGKDGLRLLPPQPPPYDDQPHILAFDLQKREAGSEVSALAVQCQAGPQGGAHVLVESIEFADRPPEGAEGDMTQAAEPRTAEPDVLRPDLWEARRDWLGNPADRFAAKAADGKLRLEVDQPGMGMKWSASLPEPVEGMQWLSVRFRAGNLDPQTWNYFVYLASAGGGKAPDEQYCVNLSDIPADGEWHLVTAPVTVPSVRTIALQVQAVAGPAWAEIDWLRFSTQKPEVKLEDVLPYKPAAAVQPPDKALILSNSLAPAADAATGLEVGSWFGAPIVTVRGIAFALAGDGAKVAATPYQQPGEIQIEADVKASELYLLLGARFARTEEPSYGGGQLRRVVDPHRFVVAITYEDGMGDEFVPGRIGPQTSDLGPTASWSSRS